jgi:hypothetical protein
MTASLIAYILAQLADVVTTERGLRRGAVEANGFIAWAQEMLGRGWIVLKLGLSGAIAYVLVMEGHAWGVWLLAGITGAVAVNNVRVSR